MTRTTTVESKTRREADWIFRAVVSSETAMRDAVTVLIERSQYFAVEPYPDDAWAIDVREIPPPLRHLFAASIRESTRTVEPAAVAERRIDADQDAGEPIDAG